MHIKDLPEGEQTFQHRYGCDFKKLTGWRHHRQDFGKLSIADTNLFIREQLLGWFIYYNSYTFLTDDNKILTFEFEKIPNPTESLDLAMLAVGKVKEHYGISLYIAPSNIKPNKWCLRYYKVGRTNTQETHGIDLPLLICNTIVDILLREE